MVCGAYNPWDAAKVRTRFAGMTISDLLKPNAVSNRYRLLRLHALLISLVEQRFLDPAMNLA